MLFFNVSGVNRTHDKMDMALRLPSNAHMFDVDLLNRAIESVNTSSILPILKDELRWQIQSRRLSQGLEELKVDFQNKPTFQLTEQEKLYRECRKERNRESAKECRAKKRRSLNQTEKEFGDLRNTNNELKNKIRKLEVEKERFMSKIVNNPKIMSALIELYGSQAMTQQKCVS